ncbi:MAG: SpoIIE family protein phosphatase [Acidobacteria bacterium]|nr:SpoIIE family protein phosphatase [Acidobacteriota bacterium]
MYRRWLRARFWMDHRGLFPRGKLSFFTLYVLALNLLLVFIQRLIGVFRPSRGNSLNGWIVFLTILVLVLGLVLLARWTRSRLLWRMRTRLVVTYAFIGVIPLILLVLIAGLAFSLFNVQFAAYIFASRIEMELRSLSVSNTRIADQIAANINAGHTEYLSGSGPSVGISHDVFAWMNGELILNHGGREAPVLSPKLPSQFSRVIEDQGKIFLRSRATVSTSKGTLTVVSSQPAERPLLADLGNGLGEVTLYSPETGTRNPRPILSDGNIPAPRRSIDMVVPMGTVIPILDWATGNEAGPAPASVQTRFSVLYDRAFSSLGEIGSTIESMLFVLLIALLLFEAAAWWIGIRVSGSITGAVGQLYLATTHVNRGDFSHRIPVTSNDQLASLATSFNSMTESIEKLIHEQKEKQRLENEITIAQEVQEQLFPRRMPQMPSLEAHGLCRPARSVSGDYYDFLPLGADRLLLAVGDVSGKGISAALLMATIHSAVRAYAMEGIPALRQVQVVGAGPMLVSNAEPAFPGAEVCPSTLLSLLNHQLYQSTPQEKYATLFLAMYDAGERRLIFSNAGHLPPLILMPTGDVKRLADGGTVVGLFDHIAYGENSVELRPGDIFIAYSDGVTEPENDFGEFGEKRLVRLVQENRDLPLERISEIVTAAVNDWIGGGEQPDDVTLVLARAR